MLKIRAIPFVFIFGCLLLSLISFDKTPTFAGVNTNTSNKPIEVRVGIQVDQITDVNQKAENFSIVGSFLMAWKDSRFAFDPTECECEEKIFNTSQFDKTLRQTFS